MRRLLAVPLPLLVVALLPAAASAASCGLSQKEQNGGLGATYVTKLSATGTSCANGKRVVRSFHSCRKANGGAKGRCAKRVRGLRCTEKRRSIPTQFNSETTCRAGGVAVRFTYTQFT